MARFPRIQAQAVAIAAALFAMPAIAQQTSEDHGSVSERPILVYGAMTQNEDHGSVQERTILVFGAMASNEDHGSLQERPILVFGAIKDRSAAPQADDPADLALPEMPVVYEERPTRR